MPIHMTLTPGVLDDTSKPLTLAFDKPKNAKLVWVVLFEIQTWDFDNKIPVDVGDSKNATPICELVGRLANGKFMVLKANSGEEVEHANLVDAKTFQAPPKDFDGQVLKLQIDGDSATYYFPLKNDDPNADGRVLEIVFGAHGMGGDLTEEPAEHYHPNTPVYISNNLDGPVVTYVAGKADGTTDDFYTCAIDHWKRTSDVFRGPPHTLTSILDDLPKVPMLPAFQKISKGPIGQLNIVSHGNEFEAFIRNLPGQQQLTVDGFKRADNVSVRTLEAVTLPSPPGPDVLGDKSIVVMRGCLVGNREPLLTALKAKFGGLASVFGPLFLIEYAIGTPPPERFVESFFVFRPSKTVLARAEATKAIGAAYPKIPASAWAGMTFEIRPRTHQQELKGIKAGLIRKETTDKGRATALSSEMAAQFVDRDMGTNFTDWGDWEFALPGGITPTTNAELVIPVIQMTGNRTKYELRRRYIRRDTNDAPILNADKSEIINVPNLQSTEHFTRV